MAWRRHRGVVMKRARFFIQGRYHEGILAGPGSLLTSLPRSSSTVAPLCWRLMSKTRRARLLVIDVDGTLLTTDYQLTMATCSAVQQVNAQGVQVVLASARSPR